MNLKIIYVPFAGDQVLIDAAGRIVRAHNSKHRLDQFEDAVYFEGCSLKKIYRFQQVYIVAHGSAGSNAVTSDTGVNLTVDALAQQLKDAELTPAINKVKLYCCEGGAGGANSTAKQLKDAMRGKSFSNVSVYGYTLCLAQGDLMESGSKMAVDAEFHDDGSYTARGYAGAKSVRQKF